jgi:hypothetical protein
MVPIVCRFKGRSDALKSPRDQIIRIPTQYGIGDFPQVEIVAQQQRPPLAGGRCVQGAGAVVALR